MDIAVIGGGIVGCHIAYRLAEEGEGGFPFGKGEGPGRTHEHTKQRCHSWRNLLPSRVPQGQIMRSRSPFDL